MKIMLLVELMKQMITPILHIFFACEKVRPINDKRSASSKYAGKSVHLHSTASTSFSLESFSYCYWIMYRGNIKWWYNI